MVRFSLFAGAVWTALMSSAFACEEALGINPKPRQSAEDCSFSDFGVTGQWSGRPARDIGDGRTGQLVVSSGSCPYQEKLHFVDCTTGQSVTINGVYEPKIQRDIDNGKYVALGGELLIKYIQAPFGSVGISRLSTAESVSAAAESAGYAWSPSILTDLAASNIAKIEWLESGRHYPEMTSFLRYAKSRSARRQFDPMCGCKLFYPDSPGAQE